MVYLNDIQGGYMELGEGNGNPLPYSCLENPIDRGACGPQPIESQELDTT